MPLEDILSGDLFLAFLIIPVLYVSYKCLMWMIEGEIDALTGVSGMFVAFSIFTLAGFIPSPTLRGIILVVVVTSVVFMPYVLSQFDARSHRLQDTSELEKAHLALERDPSNVSARFEIARVLHRHGLVGHAIAIADATERTLPTDHDPISNRSVRDMFRQEISRLKGWKEQPIPPDAFRHVQCPRCKNPNPAGTLVCQKCGGPFLLEVARRTNEGDKIVPRLVLSWIVLGILLCVATLVGSQLKTVGAMMMSTTAFVICAGVAIAQIMRVGRMRA